MGSYKDLIVWKKSIAFCETIYRITEKFPKSEVYGLTNQIRRCAVSIPSNIAEGQKRATKKDFLHFLRISYGSGAELETQLIIAKQIGYIDEKQYGEVNVLLEEIMKMLNKMLKII